MTITNSSMLNALSVSRTNLFAEGSAFVNPASSYNNTLTTFSTNLTSIANFPDIHTDAVPILNGITTGVSNYLNIIDTNITKRVESLSSMVSVAEKSLAVASKVSLVDGGTGDVGGLCELLHDIFGSISGIGTILKEFTQGLKQKLSWLVDFASDIFDKAITWTNDQITKITNFINDQIANILLIYNNDIKPFIDNVIIAINNLIDEELHKLEKLINDLLDFDFLKSFKLTGCSKSVISTVLNSSTMNTSVISI